MSLARIFFICVALTAFTASCESTSQTPTISTTPHLSHPGVLLRVLDKFTNEKKEIKTQLGTPVSIGDLTITAKACFSTQPEEAPESTAFITITNEKTPPTKEAPSISETVYENWMFSSSPSITPFEHPQYHVSIVSCLSENNATKE